MSSDQPTPPGEGHGDSPGNFPGPQQPYGQHYGQPGQQPPYGQSGPGQQQGPYGPPGAQPPYGQPYGQPSQPYGQPGQPYRQQPYGPGPGGVPPRGQSDNAALDAVGAGWRGFTRNWGTLVGLSVLLFLIVAVFVGTGMGVLFATADTTSTYYGTTELQPTLVGVITLVVLSLLSMLITPFVTAALARASLSTADGQRTSFGSAFSGYSMGAAFGTLILVTLGTVIGSFLCAIPGIIFGFMSQYALFFVLDRGASPVEAIRASIGFTRANLAQTIIFYLLSSAITAVGAMVCYVGLLVALPIVFVGQAYLYRRLQGQPTQV